MRITDIKITLTPSPEEHENGLKEVVLHRNLEYLWSIPGLVYPRYIKLMDSLNNLFRDLDLNDKNVEDRLKERDGNKK